MKMDRLSPRWENIDQGFTQRGDLKARDSEPPLTPTLLMGDFILHMCLFQLFLCAG